MPSKVYNIHCSLRGWWDGCDFSSSAEEAVSFKVRRDAIQLALQLSSEFNDVMRVVKGESEIWLCGPGGCVMCSRIRPD